MNETMRNALIGGGLLAGAAAIFSSPRRGGSLAAKLSPLQRSLLTAYRAYKADPETFIRVSDFVIGALPGDQSASNLPGIANSQASLLSDIQFYHERPDATLVDYAKLVRGMIDRNEYFTKQEIYGTPEFYGLLTSWTAPQISRLLKASRKGKLRISAATRKDFEQTRQFLTGDPENDANFPATIEEAQMLRTLSKWHEGIGELGDWLDAVRAMDPLANRMPYLLDTPVILQPGTVNFYGEKKKGIRPLTMDEAQKASKMWHKELEKQARLGLAIPGKNVLEVKGGRVEELRSRAHLKAEGQLLSHCIGRGNHYWSAVNTGTHKVHSLRDEEGLPLFTMYYSMDETGRPVSVEQIKGRSNSRPSTKKDCAMVREWVNWINKKAGRPVSLSYDFDACKAMWSEEDRAKEQAARQARGETPRPRRQQ